MSTFTFKETVKTLEVIAPGQDKKVFTYDVGNFEQMQSWVQSIDEVERITQKLKDSDGKSESVVSDLKDMEEKSITMILSQDAWNWIWEDVTNHNVMSCLRFVRHLSKEVNEAMSDMQKGYI